MVQLHLLLALASALPVPQLLSSGQLPTYRPIPESTTQAARPVEYLNGDWLLHTKPVEGWWSEPETLEDWLTVTVPGQWVQQGVEFSPQEAVACYRTFELDEDWLEGRVIVRFEAVFSHCRVFVNGGFVGEHLGGMTAFEFDVTAQAVAGENTLALEVTSWSDADLLGSLSQYTAHPMGGILRDVVLFSVPPVHIADIEIVTDFDELYEDATLEIELELINASDVDAVDLSISLRVGGADVDEEPDLPAVPAHSRKRIHFSLPVNLPRKWDPEHPELHYLQLHLAAGGAELESCYQAFGFREIEVRGNQLLLNGVPLKLRGVNRHEVHPLNGRVLELEDCREDVTIFRDANCNFIRTSHYPPSDAFLAYCDRMGMLVEVEAPIGWVGHGANSNWAELDHADPRRLDYIRQANLETVRFNRKHPSVLLWSLANESRWSENFAQVLAEVQAADPSRPQVFHDQAWGDSNNGGSTALIANQHYPGPAGPRHVTENALARPVLFGEYFHLSVYNRREVATDPGVRDAWGLALGPMWDEMYRTPGILGGALWSGIDDVFHLPDGRTTGYGPWGLVDGWRREKPEFWHVARAYSPIRLLSWASTGGDGLVLELENRFLFTDLADVRVGWESDEFEGELVGPDLPPGATGTLAFEAPAGQSLLLSFYDPRGVLVAEEFLDRGDSAVDLGVASDAVEGAEAAVRLEKREDGTLAAYAADVELLIDGQTGLIRSLSRAGGVLLSGGPHLVAAPVLADDCKPDYEPSPDPLAEVCVGWALAELSGTVEEGSVVIVARGSNDTASGAFTLRLDAGGGLDVSYDFDLALESLSARRIGVVLDVPRALDIIGWSRRAQWSSYPPDHIGRADGWSPAFYEDFEEPRSPETPPECLWSYDATPQGCNDFRATRRNVSWVELLAEDGRRVHLDGDGEQHARAWVDGSERIRLLVASQSLPTAEPFARDYFAAEITALTKGAPLRGEARFQFPH